MYYLPVNVLCDLHALSQNVCWINSHQIKLNLVENDVSRVSL